jgi:hypothetical protein
MFRAMPRLRWNSLNFDRPSTASRTMSSDQPSPTSPSDRAMGHSAPEGSMRLTMVA